MRTLSILFITILIISGCSEKENAVEEKRPGEPTQDQKEAYEKATKYTPPTSPAGKF